MAVAQSRPSRAAARKPASSASSLLEVTHKGAVAHLQLTRPEKRNALSDALIERIRSAVIALPETTRAIVISGAGEHFCAGLDMSELSERDAAQGVAHSRSWHAAFAQLADGNIPVIAALHGAVIGGGLELASAAHLRIADPNTYLALPEGTRGLFVGGGGSARISRLIGVSRMTDMMLTGRRFDAGEAERIGLVNYISAPGQSLALAFELAARVAQNAPMSNYAVIQALPRIASQSTDNGLFTESLMAAIAQSDPEAKKRMRSFLSGSGAKVKRP